MTAAAIPDPVAATPGTARQQTAAGPRANKIGALARWFAAQLVADLRGWWLLTDRPSTARDWLASTKPVRVPANNAFLRWFGTADQWLFGGVFAVASGLLFLGAGLLRWLAGHPVRRWTAVLIIAASFGAAVLSAQVMGGPPR